MDGEHVDGRGREEEKADRDVDRVPERKEPHCKGVRVLGDERPGAFGLRDDPIPQAHHVPPKLVPADDLVRSSDVIPSPSNNERRVA